MINNIIKTLNKSLVLRNIFLFLAWLAVWQTGRLVEYTEHASVWFPAAGFTFSCFLVLGRIAFFPIMAAAIVTTIWSGDHYNLPLSLNELIWAGYLFGMAHIIPYWLGAIWVNSLSQKAEQGVPKFIITFLLVAGISAFITTLLVIISLVLTNQLPESDVSKTLLPFWVGDTAGIVVLAPLFSSILIRIFPNSKLNLNIFNQENLSSLKNLVYKMALNIILIIVTMLLAFIFDTTESAFAIFFLAVTHMWIATTESPLFNVISLAVSSTIIVLLVHILGLMEYAMVYQFAINVIAANALFGIAIPQLKAHNRELEHMVFTDTLTQVSSRQYLVQHAEIEITQSHKYNSILSLAVFDLDDFKKINDHHGHTAGDGALIKACEVAKSFIRNNDIFARIGGDEFVLLFPEFDKYAAIQIVEKIRKSIHDIRIVDTQMSSSFGIAQLLPNEDFKSLFNRADQALYDSKVNGGNQINLADNSH